jgi:hypothetical protein
MVGLAFAAIYVVVAHYVAGRLFRGALADSVVLATGMAMVTSVALAGVGVLVGTSGRCSSSRFAWATAT